MVIPLPTQTMPVFLGMTRRVYLSGCGQSSTMILCKKGPPCLCGPPWTNDWLPWKNISDLDADELEFMAVQLPTLKKSMRHGSTRDVKTLSYKIRRHCTATLAVGRDAPRVGVDLTCHREHDLAAGWSGLQPIDVPQMVYLDPFPHRATDMPGQVAATVAGFAGQVNGHSAPGLDQGIFQNSSWQCSGIFGICSVNLRPARHWTWPE